MLCQMKYSYYTNTFLFVEIELVSKIMTGRYRLAESRGLQSTVEDQRGSQISRYR